MISHFFFVLNRGQIVFIFLLCSGTQLFVISLLDFGPIGCGTQKDSRDSFLRDVGVHLQWLHFPTSQRVYIS